MQAALRSFYVTRRLPELIKSPTIHIEFIVYINRASSDRYKWREVSSIHPTTRRMINIFPLKVQRNAVFPIYEISFREKAPWEDATRGLST
jgi:hypothetical protein